MKINNINEMKGGWFIGDFQPAVLKTQDFEVAHHHHPAGWSPEKHYHKLATEHNYVVSGRISIDGNIIKTGDIFTYEPGDIADLYCIEDTDIIVIKVPSIIGDKYNA